MWRSANDGDATVPSGLGSIILSVRTGFRTATGLDNGLLYEQNDDQAISDCPKTNSMPGFVLCSLQY